MIIEEQTESRLVSPKLSEAIDIESTPDWVNLRPANLQEFVGQAKLKENLKIFIEAARLRNEALDHVLLAGPPGLGKTTLAHIIAKERGANLRITSGPAIEKSGDLAALLTHLEPFDVLFIDEVHRLPRAVEEILYPALEDFKLDLTIGDGPSARSLRIDIPPFTLVGATTRSGMLSSPLRSRFGIPLYLEFYSEDELAQIITRSAGILKMPIHPEAAREIARRSRRTPRIANRMLRRVRDFAQMAGVEVIDQGLADRTLLQLEVDAIGFDPMDRKLLLLIIDQFGGGPVGIETLAASLAEDRETLEDIYEPFLLQAGFIARTPRGRIATERAYTHLGRSMPKGIESRQGFLFENPSGNS